MTCRHPNVGVTATSNRMYCLDCGQFVEPHTADPRQAWYTVGDMPPQDAFYYVAGQTDIERREWRVRRWWGEPPQWATHWHSDTLGLPACP